MNDKPIVRQCVYVPWYRFVMCTIDSCKNYTEALPCRCLAIDRKQPEGTKIISDEELRYYKFNGQSISTRLVSMKRKAAINRVKSVLILREYIQHIQKTYGVAGQQAVFQHKELRDREANFPLKIKMLGFQNWMWEYLVDSKVYDSFKKSKDGDCQDIVIADLLGFNEQRWAQFVSQLQGILF